MKLSRIFFSLSIVFTFFFIADVKATHIVGGEMYYKWLGGNNYNVTMVVYRDCYNGVPPFDNPACIEVFDSQFDSVAIYSVTVRPDSLLIPPTINNPCFIPPTNVCYIKATYNFNINLAPYNGTYYIVYQRCCRNMTINNVTNPDATGATFIAEIKLSNLYQNSNPVFNNLPPPFLCTNYPLVFDNSATDIDGDSLVYSLITPLTGADTLDPQPCPINNPPYSNVTFINPPYSVNNMLNGSAGGVALAIDPVTGLLTATPNTIGQFVTGIAVKEYRNGVYLGQTRRDYQFNVLPCPTLVVAAFLNPLTVCGSLTACFTNGSFGASSYHWDFGLPGSSDTSNAVSPCFTYPDTGTYTVTLIAHSFFNPGCADTIVGLVHLYPPIETDFFFTKDICSNTFHFNDSILNNSGQLGSVHWNFGNGSTSTQLNPTYNYPNAGNFIVTLITLSNRGCRDTVQKPLTALPILTGNTTVLNNVLCNGLCTGSGSVVVQNATGPYSILWNDPSNSVNDTIFNLCKGTYRAIITDSLGCIDSATVIITEPATLAFTASASSAYCGGRCIGTAHVSATGGTQPYTYHWSNNANTSFINNLCDGIYTVSVTDANGCTSYVDSVIVLYSDSIPPLGANIDRDTIYQGESANITSTVNSSYTYNWNPVTWLSSSTISNPVTTPDSSIVYEITITDSLGCQNRDTVRIFVINYLCGDPGIYIPNAFSPNDDSRNEIMTVRGGQIKELLFRIYDRWGEKVFETTTPGKGWDGTYKGKKVMPGVFVYYVDATCYNDITFFKKGNITVVK